MKKIHILLLLIIYSIIYSCKSKEKIRNIPCIIVSNTVEIIVDSTSNFEYIDLSKVEKYLLVRNNKFGYYRLKVSDSTYYHSSIGDTTTLKLTRQEFKRFIPIIY